MIESAKHLIFHGTLVLLFGLLLGTPYGKAINRGAPAHLVNSLTLGASLIRVFQSRPS